MEKYRNLGSIDRLIRLIMSSVLIYIGFFATELIGDTIINMALGGFGLFNLCSVGVGICPVYILAGLNTYHQDKAR